MPASFYRQYDTKTPFSEKKKDKMARLLCFNVAAGQRERAGLNINPGYA